MKLVLIICSFLFFLVSFSQAQNVGIGTNTPNSGKLEIVAPSGSQLISRNADEGSGISHAVINNNPVIGFNGMGTSTNAYSYLNTGYAGFIEYNATTGTFNFLSSDIEGTVANSSITNTLQNMFSFNRSGNVGIGLTNILEGLHLLGKNIRIDNASGEKSILLQYGNVSNLGGQIKLFANSDADSTLILNGSTSSGKSSEILFVNNSTNVRSLEISGDYNSTGRSRIIVDELQIKGGADFAEYFHINSLTNQLPQPGMLVSIDEENNGQLVLSSSAYDKKVAGVISGANGIHPGVVMSQTNSIADGNYPVAITGRIYVWADASKSAIKPGDQLTSSNIEGYAMKAVNKKKSVGTIIGKAMSALPSGKGLVLVLIGTR